MNYKIVKYEEDLQNFINELPDLKDGQKFYYCLFARKKYGATEGLKSDKNQLKRGTTTKERMIRDFKKLEVEIGSYEIDGVSINQDSLCLYMTPNPRDMHKAGLKTIKELVNFVAEERIIYNPHAVSLNQIQVSGVKYFFDIDIDVKQGKSLDIEELEDWIKGKVNPQAIWNIVKTRGGYHILIELKRVSGEFKNSWYNNFSKSSNDVFDVTMSGDNLLPVPGCVQSNFSPLLIK